ncbi:MAG TPA: discoidin domain-containing protein [Polyangiaceae bacterium]|nr:discoidin domain-containing protein [Polyangiaceae bacterium]
MVVASAGDPSVAGENGSSEMSTGGASSSDSGGTGGDTGSIAGAAGVAENVTDSNLSRGKPATTDSEQSTKQHYALDGNDGDRSTRWCAADSKLNHYWEVDLGKTYSLSALRILWEKDAEYLFKVESSVDHSGWSVVLDKTKTNSTIANQDHMLTSGATGRYVRITVTGGITATMWASFYEADIFGH